MLTKISNFVRMEYTRGEYKSKRGNVYKTTDGDKYTLSKDSERVSYLKCILFREACRSTAKLNKVTNMITLSAPHNHPNDNYHTDKFALRAKCKMAAKSCPTSLRDVFNDTTRHEESALQISFKNCESMMYRARLELQPKIPMCALDFSTIIKKCPTLNQFFRRLL